MEFLENYRLRDSINFVVLLKLFSYIFLIWNQNNDMVNHHAEEMKFKLGRTLNITFSRLLAKDMPKNDLYKTHVRQNYADYQMNKNIKNEAEKKSTYSQVKGDSLNKLDAYRKGYKRRYSKKKGLAKLECSYEKKIFDKIDYIYGLAENWNNNKKSYKKKIYDKFGVRLILCVLSPLLGLIMPILFFDKDNALLKLCANNNHPDCSLQKFTHCEKSLISPEQFDIIEHIHFVFFLLLLIVVLSIIFYTLIKIVKYEKLKSGKVNMGLKEYCRFGKEVFI
ncbi:hypothetical protein PVMG_06142 [Plasmodium vivax Mauritania I]|uniref:Variable surface protein Vir35 n=1 Tax=Plasmodium vivax Mauritania I TaxID=1035515 RepID=A0A0J9TBN5_PLAVI|nr:hypothetical protein PVMG_06142 [Plasmodium vivax Mauritania I]